MSASNVQGRNHSMYYNADENDIDDDDLLDVLPQELAALGLSIHTLSHP